MREVFGLTVSERFQSILVGNSSWRRQGEECVVGDRVGVCGGRQAGSVWWGRQGGSVWWGRQGGECVVAVVHMVQNRKWNKYELEVDTVFKVPSLGRYFGQPSPISFKIDSTAPKIAPFKTGAHGRLRRFKLLTVVLQRSNALLSETAF